MFWNTADAVWIIFRQAYLQITFPATISLFIGPLFLLLMYCPFGQSQRQSGCGETFETTSNAFWMIFQQTIHFWQQFHCLFGCCVCCRCVAILGSAKGNPGVGKHLEPLPTHFG